jgi:hypothetical protein
MFGRAELRFEASEPMQFALERLPIPLLESRLRKELGVRPADAMFGRQQVVAHFGLTDDCSFSARNFHVASLQSCGL